MNRLPDYTPPRNGVGTRQRRKFANINRPVAGPPRIRRCQRRTPYQLYLIATPNGVQSHRAAEELLLRATKARI